MTIITGFSIGAALAAAIGYLLVKNFLSTYLSEKGRNLATKEDIEEITDQVEAVRTQYVSLVEELKARHQLRLAAVDRRLQAHQEAFHLWRKVMGAVHTEEIGTVVIECQSWWERNCIYLEPTVREGFVNSYGAAHIHHSLLNSHADVAIIKSNWKAISDFPNVLFEAIQLPALSELEAKALGVKSPPSV